MTTQESGAVELISMRPVAGEYWRLYHFTFRLNGNSTFTTYESRKWRAFRQARKMARRTAVVVSLLESEET